MGLLKTALHAQESGVASGPWLERIVPISILTLLALCLFVLRMAAPENLLHQDQERPAAYVLDVIKNGNWLCQRDLAGGITSKPPLYTWTCALISIALGKVSLFALYLPGALATLGISLVLFWWGRKYFDTRSAFFGGVAVMLTTAGLKAFGLARTDGLFAFTVTLAAFLAFRAWQSRTGWVWFWIAAAATTLTKGPLGVVLAVSGLLAVSWTRKVQINPAPASDLSTSKPLPSNVTQHLVGIAIFLSLTAGWFLLAYRQEGQPFIDKLLGKELIGQVSDKGRRLPGSLFYQPPAYFLGRAAPWSLFALAGFWRIWKERRLVNDSGEPATLQFERFLFCWFFGGLLLFSFSAHQRADLLWPIMPAAALLAGKEINRLSQRLGVRLFDLLYAAIVIAGVALAAFYYFGPRTRDPVIPRTLALKALARAIEQRGGKDFFLIHTDDPMGLQIYLNTWHPPVSFVSAAESLRQTRPAYVAVNDLAKLKQARRDNDPPIYVVLPDNDLPRTKGTRIISNREGFKRAQAGK